jgi:hypothetical protein
MEAKMGTPKNRINGHAGRHERGRLNGHGTRRQHGVVALVNGAPEPTTAVPSPSLKPSSDDGTQTDRNADGKFVPGNHAGQQFAPGNKAARGNPHYRAMAELRRTVLRVLTQHRLEELLESLYKRALGGDVPAAKLLLAYALGKAAAAIDPDREDLHELALVRELPTVADVMTTMADSISAQDAIAAVADAIGGEKRQTVIERIAACVSTPKANSQLAEEVKAETAGRRKVRLKG